MAGRSWCSSVLIWAALPIATRTTKEIPTPHLHVYREGYGDKWAVPVPVDRFRVTGDVWATLEDFLRFCNITQPPHIERGLFT